MIESVCLVVDVRLEDASKQVSIAALMFHCADYLVLVYSKKQVLTHFLFVM